MASLNLNPGQLTYLTTKQKLAGNASWLQCSPGVLRSHQTSKHLGCRNVFLEGAWHTHRPLVMMEHGDVLYGEISSRPCSPSLKRTFQFGSLLPVQKYAPLFRNLLPHCVAGILIID